MIFALVVALGLMAQDVFEVAYDESEAVPYEAIPSFSMVSRTESPSMSQTMTKSDCVNQYNEGTEDRPWLATIPSGDARNILDQSMRC